MASTNKTPNLGLSQFQPLDKPAWLGDYNQDMSKIDTAVHNNQTKVDSMETNVNVAISSADAATKAAQAATEAAAEATSVAQNAQTTANNVSGTATQALTLAQQAQEAAETAQNNIDDVVEALSSYGSGNGMLSAAPAGSGGVGDLTISAIINAENGVSVFRGNGYCIATGSIPLIGGTSMAQVTTLGTINATNKNFNTTISCLGMAYMNNQWLPVHISAIITKGQGNLNVTKYVGVTYPSQPATIIVFSFN